MAAPSDRHWAALSVYREPRVLAVLALGFSSGLPLALTGATLTFWLAEAGIEIGVIGFFAWVGLAYGWKFLWAPVVDRLPLPLLTRLLGRRRAWLVLSQALLIAAIVALGASDPHDSLWVVALWAVLVAFLSATQDIVIDAYRVDILDERQQGAGAAAVTLGYRLAMFASGAGALVVAEWYGWFWAYAAMATLLPLGTLAVLLIGEPAGSAAAVAATRTDAAGWARQAVVEPFGDFFRRNGASTAVLILVFILLYKLGDALLAAMMSPFYVDLGFAKTEVAAIVKTWGLAATLAGALLGGAVVRAQGLVRALWICGIAQMLSNLVYLAQVAAGHDNVMLAVTVTVENLTGGMGTAAFVAYLSALCNLSYTATQYALLSSLMAQGRTFFAGFAGQMVAAVGWAPFFVLTTIAAVPGLALLWWLQERAAPQSAPDGPGLAVGRG